VPPLAVAIVGAVEKTVPSYVFVLPVAAGEGLYPPKIIPVVCVPPPATTVAASVMLPVVVQEEPLYSKAVAVLFGVPGPRLPPATTPAVGVPKAAMLPLPAGRAVSDPQEEPLYSSTAV
jgi:hypothetical protein